MRTPGLRLGLSSYARYRGLRARQAKETTPLKQKKLGWGTRYLSAPKTYSNPNSFQRLVTRSLISGDILISSGQGRVKPSVGHFRVASMPILEP